MREKTCCFTGHRQISAEYLPAISEKLRDTLIFFIEQGFDTLAAQTVLTLKQRYPCIKLILVLPCKDQAAKWRASDVKEYERIKSHADKIVYTADRYYNGCMQKRNRHLVDGSSLCVCYLAKQEGGTAYTVQYAREKGLQVVNIAE